MKLPGCDTNCWRHTVSVSGQHIKVCCWKTNRFIILNLDGRLKSMYGPEIEVLNDSSEAANRDGSVKRRLCGPSLCQEDDEGNVFIADEFHDRLLLFTADNMWLDAGFKRPTGAVSLNRRLYVSSGYYKISMFE